MSEKTVRVLGTGYAVPKTIRRNDDPVFDWLRAHIPHGTDLFKGYDRRPVLAPAQDLMTILVPAARAALKDAGTEPGEIDLLLGMVSVSEFQPPNALTRLHARLRLQEHCWVVPLANDFSNFNAGLLFADAMIRAGRARKAMVCVGTNWTRYVSYRTPQAISAADGAGAAVLGAASRGWRIVDQEVLSASKYFGTMAMRAPAVPLTLKPPLQGDATLYDAPTFQINAAGSAAFKTFGAQAAPQAVVRLLKRNRIKPAQASLIAHQVSSVLADAWIAAIRPGQFIETLAQYADMTAANIPVNLAWAQRHGGIARDQLVLFALAPDMHAHALLLSRH